MQQLYASQSLYTETQTTPTTGSRTIACSSITFVPPRRFSRILISRCIFFFFTGWKSHSSNTVYVNTRSTTGLQLRFSLQKSGNCDNPDIVGFVKSLQTIISQPQIQGLQQLTIQGTGCYGPQTTKCNKKRHREDILQQHGWIHTGLLYDSRTALSRISLRSLHIYVDVTYSV